MSSRFALTEAAEQDAFDIWNHVANAESERAADRVLARIYDECEKLAEMPGMGHFRDDLASRQVRVWSVWSYLIIYCWQTSPIEIIAIIHGARQVQAVISRRLGP